MKRSICAVAALALMAALAACSMQVNAAGSVPSGGEILFVTDDGADSAVTRAIWSGIEAYAQEAGLSPVRIKAPGATPESRIYAMESGITEGVRLVICAGPGYEATVFECQTAYPGVMFLLLDGEPHSLDDQVYETTANTHCILFRQDEAGFLAGYAAVMEGYRNLGFCGDSATADVIRCAYGFIQGADLAAVRLGLSPGALEISCRYIEKNETPEEIRSKMLSWYEGGTQLIFAYDGGQPKITATVISAAVAKEGAVIGAGANRSSESLTILSSAVHDYGLALSQALQALEENGGLWPADRAGQTKLLGAAQGAVGLATSSSAWRFQNFTQATYGGILQQLMDGTIHLEHSGNRELLPAVSICSISDPDEN